MKLSTLFATLLTLVLLGAALAQSPASTATRVFDRVYASEVPCSAVPEMAMLLSSFDYGFCGFINDKMTDINKRWTAEELRADGYVPAVDWEVTRDGAAEYWISGYANGRYTVVPTLLMSRGVDGTAILLGFND